MQSLERGSLISKIIDRAKFQEITEKINWLEQEANAHEAELQLFQILTALLETDGYNVIYNVGPGDMGVDYLAQKETSKKEPPLTIGIQYKHSRSDHLVGVSVVQQIIGVSLLNNLDRMILLSRSGFSKQAWSTSKRDLPTSIELMDLNALKVWVSRIERAVREDYSGVIKAIVDLSKLLARIIAKNPRELDHIEWRDMERMLASVFDELGFRVELTPSSKDGGKDIILEFSILGSVKQSYLVEIKHWRSKQKVGQGYINDFINVIAKEKSQGGLYLATYGYSNNAFEALTEVERNCIRFGTEEKIISLCRTFVKAESGLWSAPPELTELLIEGTFLA